jgi:hypothetical protein
MTTQTFHVTPVVAQGFNICRMYTYMVEHDMFVIDAARRVAGFIDGSYETLNKPIRVLSISSSTAKRRHG